MSQSSAQIATGIAVATSWMLFGVALACSNVVGMVGGWMLAVTAGVLYARSYRPEDF